MSERILALLLALGCAAGPLHAQSVEQLERRRANLTARLERMNAASAEQARLAFDQQPRTVVTVDGFSVAVPVWATGETREALPTVMAAHRERYGIALDSLLKDTLIIWLDEGARARGMPYVQSAWRLGAEGDSAGVFLEGGTGNDWVSWIPARAIDRWAHARLDPTFVAWLGATEVGGDLRYLLNAAARNLLISPSTPARACLNGGIESCKRGLDLTSGASDLVRWYDPADIPGLFTRTQRIDTRTPGRAICISSRDLEQCAEVLRTARVATPRPVGNGVHESLYAYALATGGASAWLRLEGARGLSVPDQLAAAAGIPVDSLIAGWQHAITIAPETAAAGLGPVLLLALAWSVVVTIFFAWRFRWRHV